MSNIMYIPHIPLKYKLLPEDKELWLQGLEDYDKACHSLYKVTRKGDESYCCLGVAAVTILKAKKSTLFPYRILSKFLSEESQADHYLNSVLGQPLSDELKEYAKCAPNSVEELLSSVNDKSKTFNEVKDIIKKFL